MEENLIAEIRQLLQEMVVPDLATIMLKLDAIQQQFTLTQQSVRAEIAAFQVELESVHAEIKSLRAEMRGHAESEEAPVNPQRYLM